MNTAAYALAWTLIHFLWEGTLIACGLALALRIAGNSAARVRYGLASLTMLAMLGAFGITLWQVWPRTAELVRAYSLHAGVIGSGLPTVPVPTPADDSRFRWLALIWALGVCGFSLRSLMSWLAAQRLRRTGICLAPDHWQTTLRCLATRIGLIRAVSLYESALAEVPVVIGFLRPMILVPAGLLANFPAEQLEYFLIHELAHIRRCDCLVNLLQSLTEDLLFFHPAVWWVSKSIRDERENCCDDVVRVHADAHEYAAALAALEQNRWTGREAALAATGGHLMNRIQRLMDRRPTSRPASAALVAGTVLTGMILLGAIAFPILAPAQPADPWTKWLNEEVRYIITAAERSAFQALPTDAERLYFIDQFWARRNPTPGAGQNPFKEEHYRRIAYANGRFSTAVHGWQTDRGRIYITFGPPDEIDSHPNGGEKTPLPYEQWLYRYLEGIGNDVHMDFVDVMRDGSYRMTMDPDQANATPVPRPQ